MLAALTVLGVSWSDGAPSVQVRRLDGEPVSEPLIGQSWAFRVDETARRWCLGSEGPGHAATPCLEPPSEGRRTCTSCSVKNALFAGALHHAHKQDTSDPDVVKHLDQPNRLYVAAFRDGSMKIGTSTEHRANTRLLEQGAWMARFVATTTNGVTVRVIEDLVTEQLALPQSVAITRKLSGLATPRDDAWLSAQLDGTVSRVHDLITASGLVRSGTSTCNDEWRNPAVEAELWNRIYAYPHRLDHGSHTMIIVGAVGRAVAFRRDAHESGDVFTADLQQIFGLGLAESDENDGPAPVAVQDQLF